MSTLVSTAAGLSERRDSESGGHNVHRDALAHLPIELLHRIVPLLRDIEDFMNLSSSCRYLREALARTLPNTIFRLAAAATRIFFRPSPHFLVAAVAPQLSEWARQSSYHTKALVAAFRKGIDGLFELCVEKCGLTMADIRRLHVLRFETINPVVDLVDKCVGEQWLNTPNFWDGGASDAATIMAESSEIFFAIAIYAGLFAYGFDGVLQNNLSAGTTSSDTTVAADAAPVLDVDVRLEYLKYCAPDWTSFSMCSTHRGAPLDPRRVIYPEGPYNFSPERITAVRRVASENHLGLIHLCERSSRWRAAWAAVRHSAERHTGLDVSDSKWKMQLWEEIVVLQGLDGLRLIRHWNKPEEIEKDLEESGLQAKLANYLVQIVAMTEEPRTTSIGRQKPYEHWPSLLGDLYVCISGYYPGT